MRKCNFRLASLGAVIAGIFCFGQFAQAGTDLSNVFGCVHDAGVYYFGSLDYMDQGAQEIAALGTHVIKGELDAHDLFNTWTSGNSAKYPWNSNWPSVNDSTTILSISQVSYWRNLFANPNFKTYVLTTYCPNIGTTGGENDEWWKQTTYPLSTSELNQETTQVQNLCANLLASYSGKTFIIENWEADGALGADDVTNSNTTLDMAQWITARYIGVHNAMAAKGSSTSNCYCSFEVNLVKNAMNEGVSFHNLTATNDVLPNCSTDYGSYSAYDTQYNTNGANSFPLACQWLADHLPSTAINGQTTASLLVGEFGVGQSPGYEEKSAASVDQVINTVTNTVLSDNMLCECYWVIYDNDIASGLTAPVNGNNDGVEGYWMIRPDGTPGEAWHQARAHLIGSSPTRANTTEITNALTNSYTSAFPSSGTSFGTGWTTNTNSGDYTIAAQNGNMVMQLVQGASTTPVGTATLDIDTVAGRGMQPSEYLQFSLQRLSNTGTIGWSIFNDNHGSGAAGDPQVADVWSDNAWVPFSFNISGANPTYTWANNNTVGMRLDSADGTFATCSYYMNGAYMGSWVYQTTATTLDSFSLIAQSSSTNASFQFGNLSIYLNPDLSESTMNASATSVSSSTESTDSSDRHRDRRHR